MLAPPSTSVDKSIRTNLLSLQTSFFQSLRSGTDAALTAFYQEMLSFNETLSLCAQDLEDETYRLIDSFVQTSNAVIPALIDVYVSSDKITQELNEDISNALAQLSLDDTAHSEQETYPPYILPAHVWLLNNLHNPYPSKQTRTTLSKETGAPQKDIDSWFTDIRKRIGWNSLRKKHFSTRKDMIAAATRFFKPSSIQLDPGTEPEVPITFDQEFALLEDSAKNLYSRRFSTSTLATRLTAAKDVTPEPNPAGQGNLARQMSSQEVESTPYSPYTSPSPPTFSSPSPPPSPLQPSQGRKRRQSDSDSSTSIEARPLKRTRIDNSTDRSPLPATQCSARQHSPSLTHSSCSSTQTSSISISEPPRKRKRRSSLSDSEDDQGRTKRSHCLPSPSNHSIEPLPSEPRPSNVVDLDHWLKSLCGEGIDLGHSIPEPVYETSPLAAGVEIDFYRYASSSPSISVSSLGPSTPPDYYSTSDSPSASHQSLSFESPSLTKAQGYDGVAYITSESTSTNWCEESFLFDLNAPSILDADFPFQNWDLGLTPAMSVNNYSISQVLQEVVDESTHSWTNEEPTLPISISIPKPSNQLSPLTSFSDNSINTPIPQIFPHPSLDKKGKIRYLQTLLNEVQNVRLDLAI